jgi:Protein of unknown function (DUF3071)
VLPGIAPRRTYRSTMRQLRLVTLADDGSHLVMQAADGDEMFGLPVDPVLRKTVGTERPAAAPRTVGLVPAPGSVTVTETGEAPIGPRDIQVRVRAGESPEQLADTYAMSLERVMRFAAPVVEERARISGEARRARARRNTTDGQVVVFGEAVDDRFGAYGIAADTVTWDARRRDDGEWVVVATWPGTDATHSAEWIFSRSSRSVAPIDDAAADLLSDRPIRPVLPPEPERPSLVAAPPLRPGVVAFPPMPDAHTGPLPRIEEVFDQDAPPEGPRIVAPPITEIHPTVHPAARPAAEHSSPTGEVSPAAPAAVPAASSAPAVASDSTEAALSFDEPPLDFDEPPLPLVITDPAARPGAVPSIPGLRTLGSARRSESDEDRAARARVPSWDDILLGVRRKSD